MRLAKIFMSTAAALLTVTASYSPAFSGQHRGVVIEAITGGGYTYLNIDENGEKFWIAGPQTSVAKGAEVSFNEQVWMPNFTSRALNRTFEKILFVSGVDDGSPEATSADDEGASDVKEENVDEIHSGTGDATDEDAAATEEEADSEEDSTDEEETDEPLPADGVYTVEDIYNYANRLKGEIIKVRGEVVKVSENIMGMTWVHIQDGTGTKGKNKLVFRSNKDTAKVGDTVIAEGRLDADKDFGFGYYYSVIVEDASFMEVVDDGAADAVEETQPVKP